MKKSLSTLTLGLSILIGGVSCSANAVKGEVIPLASYKIVNGNALSFAAVSKGCSQNTHFSIHVEKLNDNTASISVFRVMKDRCKRMPFFETFELPLRSDLQGKKLVVLNPKAQPISK